MTNSLKMTMVIIITKENNIFPSHHIRFKLSTDIMSKFVKELQKISLLLMDCQVWVTKMPVKLELMTLKSPDSLGKLSSA